MGFSTSDDVGAIGGGSTNVCLYSHVVALFVMYISMTRRMMTCSSCRGNVCPGFIWNAITLYRPQITTRSGEELLLQSDDYPTISRWHDAIKKTADRSVSHFITPGLRKFEGISAYALSAWRSHMSKLCKMVWMVSHLTISNARWSTHEAAHPHQTSSNIYASSYTSGQDRRPMSSPQSVDIRQWKPRAIQSLGQMKDIPEVNAGGYWNDTCSYRQSVNQMALLYRIQNSPAFMRASHPLPVIHNQLAGLSLNAMMCTNVIVFIIKLI